MEVARQAAIAAQRAEAALLALLTGRGETVATVRQLVDDLGAEALKETAWMYAKSLHDIAQWFRPGMTHEAFARNMFWYEVQIRSFENEVAFWKKACPNMTFAEIEAYYERNLVYFQPDDMVRAS